MLRSVLHFNLTKIVNRTSLHDVISATRFTIKQCKKLCFWHADAMAFFECSIEFDMWQLAAKWSSSPNPGGIVEANQRINCRCRRYCIDTKLGRKEKVGGAAYNWNVIRFWWQEVSYQELRPEADLKPEPSESDNGFYHACESAGMAISWTNNGSKLSLCLLWPDPVRHHPRQEDVSKLYAFSESNGKLFAG